METILITGGSGFIGSHTCVSLLENSYRLIIIDSNINSSSKSIDKVKEIVKHKIKDSQIIFQKGDIRDSFFLKKIFSESLKVNKPIKAVIHFAGLKSVEESVNNPILYWDVNVFGSICLFKVMEEYKCKIIVFSSSATIYGNAALNPITEKSLVQPFNPYGHTKASVESILVNIFQSEKQSSWRIANLRYFNPIGAHESGLIGENPLNKPNNLFPIICEVAKNKNEKLHIYGDNWPTIDGTGVRDYIHVMDLAEAHRSALEFLFNNDPQVANINIGTGIGTSVLELVQVFKSVNGCDVPYEICGRRKGDVANVIADNKKAISILNWQPQRSIEDMCRDGWRWQSKNKFGYL